ncbi:MAG: hypothetical protein Q9190_007094, partial [Brigantiaea leucoxantha]
MKPKKIHEVQHLARYVTDLSADISRTAPYQISHFVDFGSGQNYLGRTLASQPYNRQVVAMESKSLNIDGARSMDVAAKLAKKEVVMRNKKAYRNEIYDAEETQRSSRPPEHQPHFYNPSPSSDCKSSMHSSNRPMERQSDSNIKYVQTVIQDGDLSAVMHQIKPNRPQPTQDPPNNSNDNEKSTTTTICLMTISLHSCGNLLHHGLRSLLSNASVKAVAMVGCCYNLLTERCSLSTYKHPTLRPTATPRLEQTSSASDPAGFPMSNCLSTYPHSENNAGSAGIRFNITARMMAVQAPRNWTETDCNSFFTRHFYRALLQKIFVDRGVFSAEPETQAHHTDNDDDIPGKKKSSKLDANDKLS